MSTVQKKKEKMQKKPNGQKAARKPRQRKNDKRPAKLQGVGTHGVDPASSGAVPQEAKAVILSSPGALETINIIVPVSDRSIAYLAMGIVLKAIRKGSESVQSSLQFPYFQYLYLYDVFVSMMTSSVPLLTVAPKWMWELLYALKPKKNRFKTGYVNYSWEIRESGVPIRSQMFQLGTGGEQYYVWWGTEQTPDEVGGWPVLGPVATPYDIDKGAAAISGLWPFVSDLNEPLHGDPGADGVSTGNDTSAFAVVYPELGQSYFAEGAVRTTIYSERFIDSPMLCQFGIYQELGSPNWRGWQHARVGCGSPCLIGPRLVDNSLSKKASSVMRNKGISVLKYYNFDEFYDQLGYTLGLAMNNLAKSAGQTVETCPLTIIEVQLLLRQTIMQVCCNEYAQDVRYAGPSFISMLPFTTGPNGTNGGSNINMMLPTFLAENIRAISKIETKVSDKFPTTVTWYPILCRPPGAAQLGNYLWSGGSVFAESTYDVNIIDCSVQVGQDTYFLDLTRTEIGIVTEKWNTWIQSLSAVMSPLVTVTSESGIRKINCNLYSNIDEVQPSEEVPTPVDPITGRIVSFTPACLAKQQQQQQQQPQQQQATKNAVNTTANMLLKKTSKKAISIGTSLKRFKVGSGVTPTNSYFMNVGERKITNVTGFDKRLDQIMDSFILPVNFSQDAVSEASLQGYQAFLGESCSKPRSTSGGYGDALTTALLPPTANERHLRAAAYDVKQFATTDQQNEVISVFVELAKTGRGGFLSSALGGLANFFAPGTGKFVSDAVSSLGG